MPWMPLRFQPGVFRDRTFYSEAGRWYDSNLVRFRQGLPERWGGWQEHQSAARLEGFARSIFRHSDLTAFEWISIGTTSRFYMISDDVVNEVTPIESTTTLGSNPLSVTSGSNIIEVTHASAERLPGDVVIISGATATGGIPASEINAEHTVVSYIDGNTYTIQVTSNASSTATGGGASVQVQYLYNPGSLAALQGAGWGRLTWGEEGWGETDGDTGSEELGQWSQENFGEDLVACIRNGPIFYWDATNSTNRMVNIRDLASADGNAPTKAEFIVVSERDRHLLAFGGTEFSTGNDAPMAIRWCDQENILNWDEASSTSTAGSLPLSNGSKFLAAVQTNNEILAWTTSSLYSIQFVGAPNVYVSEIIENHSDILGLNAATYYNTTVFWVGRSGFYAYTGQVDRLDSPVWDYFSQDVDFAEAQKIFVSSNSLFGEVIYLYQSKSGTDVDSYITFNPTENYWTIGRLARTVWLDTDSDDTPTAVGTDGRIYEHEIGADDGSTNPPQAINAYIESAPFELSSEGSFDKGDRFMFIRKIMPDVTFRSFDDGSNTPMCNIVLKTIDEPGAGITPETTSAITKEASVSVDQFTNTAGVRLRGRGLIVRIESDSRGSLWRLGTPRIDVRTDGQR